MTFAAHSIDSHLRHMPPDDPRWGRVASTIYGLQALGLSIDWLFSEPTASPHIRILLEQGAITLREESEDGQD